MSVLLSKTIFKTSLGDQKQIPFPTLNIACDCELSLKAVLVFAFGVISELFSRAQENSPAPNPGAKQPRQVHKKELRGKTEASD